MVTPNSLKSLFVLIWCCCVSVCWAQPQTGQTQVNAFLSQEKITLNETAVLTISIGSVNDTIQFHPPDLIGDGLRFRPAGTRRSYTNINGTASAATEYDYVVEPLKVGRHVIPAISGTIGGRAFQTQSLRLEVVDSPINNTPATGYQPPNPGGWNQSYPPLRLPNGGSWMDQLQPAKTYDLETDLEKSEVYEHQVAPYTLRVIYRRSYYSQEDFFYVKPTGFLAVKADPKDGLIRQDGEDVDTREVTTLLYGLNQGTYEIPAREIPISSDKFSTPTILRSEPRILVVKPLPSEGRPEGFTGAVGQKFEIDAFLRRDVISAGQTVELSISVKGDGHLDLVPYPYLPDWNGIEKKQTSSPSTMAVKQDVIESRRTYNFRLKVNEPGEYELKGIALSYFNPQEERYETIKTPSLRLKVEANKNAAAEQPDKTLADPADSPYQSAAGETELSSVHLSSNQLLAAWGLTVLGFALTLLNTNFLKGGPSLRRKNSWRARSHKSFKELIGDLADIAPGPDAEQRQKQLLARGLNSENISRFEELKRRVQEAEYGHSDSPLALTQASRELSQLMKGSKS